MQLTKKKRIVLIVAMVLVCIIGILITVYPLIASRHADRVRSEVQTQYEEVLDGAEEKLLAQLKQEADKWNEKLFSGEISPVLPQENGYYETLDLPDTNVMALIRVPVIGIELPVYHSIADEVLTKGVGHMPQSSLPVGGVNTHSVLSAHTGLETGPMFSDLERMELGDIFYIDVLGQTLTYQVFDIEVVVPEDITSVQIQRDKDLCTLLTCTPYGVNTHRLLVHGQRIPTKDVPEETVAKQNDTEPEQSVWMDEYYRSIKLGIIFFLVIVAGGVCVICIGRRIKSRKTKPGDDENQVQE